MVFVQRIISLVVLVVLGLMVNQLPAAEANRVPAKGGRCVEGSTWKEECNSCMCSNGVAACTMMACLPQYVARCTEGHSRPSDDGCNTCKCTNGVYACTRRACPDQVDRCTEGHSKPSELDDCNTCICDNGRFVCTERDCSLPQVCSLPKQEGICEALIPSYYYNEDRQQCLSFNYGGCGGNANRFRFLVECENICGHLAIEPCTVGTYKCTNGVYVCNERACPDQVDRCTEGHSKPSELDDCNTCICDNGRFVCTERACSLPQVDRCTEGHSKPSDDGCNTCKCTHGEYACTRRACPDQVDRCTEGHSKPSDDGCNTCKCTNGVYSCTRRACPDQVERCVEGHTEKADDGCNTCYCVNGGYECTEIGCPPKATWRDDFKCGSHHLAPNGEPAQCDPYGEFPCCSVYGWCGKSGDHCECTDCVDHRDNFHKKG